MSKKDNIYVQTDGQGQPRYIQVQAKKSRNFLGLVGFLVSLATPIVGVLSFYVDNGSTTFMWSLLMWIVSTALCLIGIFKNPKVLPALGLCLNTVLLVILLICLALFNYMNELLSNLPFF